MRLLTGYFEVVRLTGSVLCQTVLWECLWDTIDSFLCVRYYKVAEETESICPPKRHTCSTIQRDTDSDSRATLKWQVPLKKTSPSEQNWCRMQNLGRKMRQNSHWKCLKSKTVIWPIYWLHMVGWWKKLVIRIQSPSCFQYCFTNEKAGKLNSFSWRNVF